MEDMLENVESHTKKWDTEHKQKIIKQLPRRIDQTKEEATFKENIFPLLR